MTYRLSHEAKRDVARIYWRGVEAFGEEQAVRYFEALIQRFESIAQAPYLYPAVEHIQVGYRRSVCGVDSILPADWRDGRDHAGARPSGY
jgi:toxin ParE1/3/4